MKYDYVIVGAGLYGSICAYELNKAGYKVLVIDKRNHIGGNIYTEKVNDINVHKYGAHIFHTSNKEIWDYINQFAEFNNYINSPIANYKGEIYNLPFNMNTFSKIWDNVITPKDAKEHIIKEKYIGKITNLEEQAKSLVGTTIYEKLVKEYTEKQWGKECKDLPPFIIKRLPVRFTYNNNYFNDKYQGIPIGGYTQIIEKLLEGIDIILNENYLDNKDKYKNNKIIYTGPIDEYYDYCYGKLEYRSLRFEEELLLTDNYQGNAVVNYTSNDVPYTRIIEHKHFENTECDWTIITKEYPVSIEKGKDPYYPINNDKNNELYSKYKELADKDDKVIFGGRLGSYKYYDMDKTIEQALLLINKLKKE